MNPTRRRPFRPTIASKLHLSLLALTFGVACGANGKTNPSAGDAGSNDVPGVDAAAGGEGTRPAGDDSLTPLPGANTGDDSMSPITDPTPTVVDTGGFISVGMNDAGTFEIWCGSALCACSDGEDNDGDGVADGFDAECTGPFDDDETTFATGIPGDNRDPKWQDCFFDGNSGAGDDGCRYHTECLTGDREPDDPDCTLTEQCVEYCQPLTPPGCDCFGCCEIADGDRTVNVMLGEACSLDNLDDEELCPRCVPSDACNNECGECELCLGKTLEDLPESCGNSTPPGGGDTPDGSVPPDMPGTDGGTPVETGEPTTPSDPGDPGDPSDPGDPVNVCDNGTACTSSTDCDTGDYCRLGCCVPFGSNIR